MSTLRAQPPALTIVVVALLSAFIGGLAVRELPTKSTESAMARSARATQDLPGLVARTAPAVVNIAVLQPSPAEQNPLLRDPFFRQYFGVPDTALQPAIAAGSGVIVDSARGLVVTNFHVVQNARAVEIGLKDGRQIAADPVAFAPSLDLAVLRVAGRNLPALALGDSKQVQVGQSVVAIGNPFGLGQTVTAGIVSATDRAITQGDSRRFLQTDAPINPGNSGGPLIDTSGRVIGINSALFSPDRNGQGNIGIGFAIPSNVVRQVLQRVEG